MLMLNIEVVIVKVTYHPAYENSPEYNASAMAPGFVVVFSNDDSKYSVLPENNRLM